MIYIYEPKYKPIIIYGSSILIMKQFNKGYYDYFVLLGIIISNELRLAPTTTGATNIIEVLNEYDRILMNIKQISHVADNPYLLLKAASNGISNKQKMTVPSVLIKV